MKLEIVIFKTQDGKKCVEVLSKNSAVKLLIQKFNGEVSGIRTRVVVC